MKIPSHLQQNVTK